ncbi:replication initiator protein A [Tautonia sociabilis]|uniref:Replication initiator protein A n=1 Tax=Tautonia sociabilis TaxID=2080755 RepID=A0A432MFG3_9BACT|nr:replication initiator protein A [Tautonia sociabilis]RUL84941.1 replication initiator protein A [Tautonia sociabilis]
MADKTDRDRTPSLFDDPEEVPRADEAPEDPSAEPAFKDELNLAEFPIASLADRVPDGQTTLVFEDKLDRRDGPPIVRRLTIMGTAKHGLPTSMDDEVLVGLIQLTKRWNNFTEAKVNFSRYELIELLGWPQTGQSYRRIEEALHRWVGVVLSYENAWWDNAAKSWVDENFHVLDNVTIYDRERRRPSRGGASAPSAGSRRRGKRGNAPPPLSSFKWNEVIFRSFQSGNLKQIDLEFYLRLRLPTTKRVFRFLDKRFYRCNRLEFDLRTFACEHVGLSRSYKPTELKRRLRPAIAELEQNGFLEPMDDAGRYLRKARGHWQIVFVRGPRGRSPIEPTAEERAELAEALAARGVAARTAGELVERHAPEHLRAKLAIFDWMAARDDKRLTKNPAGYLVASIREDYGVPEDYVPPADAERLARAEAAVAEEERRRRDAEAAEEQRRRDAEAAEAARLAGLKARWEALAPEDRDAIVAQVKAAHPGLRRWKTMLEPLCLAALEARLDGGTAPGQPSLFPADSGDDHAPAPAAPSPRRGPGGKGRRADRG